MNFKFLTFITILSISIFGCSNSITNSDTNIILLHHSTGKIIWNGKQPSLIEKVLTKLGIEGSGNAEIPKLMKEYNSKNNTNYSITELTFPKSTPYGWNNYPYDYYNIWVKNAGEEPYMEEPTLEILTKKYQVILFKHCFPVCFIKPDEDSANINSNLKTLANYKLQYNALKIKMHEFPKTKFIIWTGAAQVKENISEESAQRANQFFNWVTQEWDEPEDNIYIWDLYNVETDGTLYLKDEFAVANNNPHPNSLLAEKASNLLFNRIIDIIENDGKNTTLTGKNL